MQRNVRVGTDRLIYSYPNGNNAVKNFTGFFPGGSLTALFGPNGSGKTTVLKCLAGILEPSGGRIEANGRDMVSLAPAERSRLAAYVPQQHRPAFPYTAGEVVLMGRTPSLGGVFGPKRKDIDLARAALESVNAADLWDSRITELSGGQRQLVLIARAIAQDTPVVLLDEPTAALDVHHQLGIWRLLRSLGDGGRTIIASVHDPNQVLWFCDRAVIMSGGAVLAEGDCRTVFGADTLLSLYGPVCSLTETGGIPVIVPGADCRQP